MDRQKYFADFTISTSLKEASMESSCFPAGQGYNPDCSPVRQSANLVSTRFWPLYEPPYNRRRLPRFTPRREIFVIHREFGQVINISMGGICFTYLGNTPDNGELPREGMIFDADLFLHELPVTTVSDFAITPLDKGKNLFRKRRLQFGDMSQSQMEKLEEFIIKNAHIPQLSIPVD